MQPEELDGSLFRLIRSRMPDLAKPFLEADGGRHVTYGDLLGTSARFAHALRALGVSAGDRVAVQADKSPEMLLAYLACLRVGAIFLPLNTGYTLAEVEYFVGDAEPALLLCRPAALDAMRALGARLGVGAVESLGAAGDGTFLERAAGLPETLEDAPQGPDDLAAILYTSGTTGRSKGAMMSHRNLGSNALSLAQAWRFTAADVLIHALPIYHTHGLFVATNVMLLCGGSMLFRAKFDADAVLADMARATALMGVPTFYTRLADHPGLTREAVAHMRVFISGSAPLLAETHAAFAAKTGHAILERYGMTETNMITSNPYEGARIPGAVGQPLPGVEVRLAGEGGAAVEPGGVGTVELRGPNVFRGYWRMPEKTAAEFRPGGWFSTGDLGTFGDDGYLRLVGRAKDLVISGGFNVYPKEVEAEIDALDGVLESAVIGLPHRDFGEGVTAVVVPRPGVALDEGAMLSALEGRLARFKLPKRILSVEDLPRNAMGKVQKNLLRERFAGLYS